MSKLKEYAVLTATLLVTVVAGVALGSTVVSARQPSEEPDDRQYRPVSGSHVIGATVADVAQESPWAVRTYRGQTGLTCFESGQVRDGAFGRKIVGEFRAFPESEPTGVCGETDTSPTDTMMVFDGRGTGEGSTIDRSILSGVAGDSVASVTVTRGGTSQRLTPSGANRTFLTVFDGKVGFADVVISVTFRDGTTQALPKKPAAG